MPDGWQGYLDRVDGILSWCRRNHVPVRTYTEWAEVLYNVRTDPKVNVFPNLGVDLDADCIPDGYDVLSAERVRNEGAPDGPPVYLAVRDAGPICKVERLGGLEKGANTFSVRTFGQPGDAIEATFRFFEVGSIEKHVFSVAGPEWTEQSATLEVPPEASLVNVSIECTRTGGGLKLGGMRLSASE